MPATTTKAMMILVHDTPVPPRTFLTVRPRKSARELVCSSLRCSAFMQVALLPASRGWWQSGPTPTAAGLGDWSAPNLVILDSPATRVKNSGRSAVGSEDRTAYSPVVARDFVFALPTAHGSFTARGSRRQAAVRPGPPRLDGRQGCRAWPG